MNKSVLLLAFLLLSSRAHAADQGASPANAGAELSQDQKSEISRALSVLINSHTLRSDGKDGVQLDPNIIQSLKEAGLLTQSTSSLSTICIGPAQ